MPRRRVVITEGVARLPLRTLRVQADGHPSWDDTRDTIIVSGRAAMGRPNAFAAIVTGTCMMPTVMPGAVVLIDPDQKPTDGKMVVVTTDHGDTLVKWYRLDDDGQPYLRAADGTSSRPSRTFDSREQAEHWARGDVQPAVLLLGHWLDRWLALRWPTIRPHTQRNYRAAVGKCLPIAAIPLGELTTEHLQAHVNALLSRQARSSVAVWRNIISGALNAAVPRLLTHNPMRGVRLPRETEGPSMAWTAAEVARLIDVSRGLAHEVWLWLSLGTGLRVGESRALLWADINLQALTVRVDKAVNGLTGKVGPTKSGKARIVDLPEEAVPLLVAHRARQRPQERHVCTSGYSGRVPSPSTLRTWLEQRIAAAGVTPLPLHSTRRTFGTLALEAGTPLKEVSEALGHASVAVTAKAYSHIVNQRQRRAAAAMGAVLAPKPARGAKIGTRQEG